jgi:outer membrane receptor protein involved in Fe transport
MLWLHDRDSGYPGSVVGHPPDEPDDRLSCMHAEEQATRGLARLAWRGALGRDGGLELSGFHRRESNRFDDPGGACDPLRPLVTGGRTGARLRENATGLDLLSRAPELELGPLWVSLRGSTSVRHEGVTSDDSDAQRRTSGAFSLLADAEVFDRRLRILPALGFDAARTSDGLARSASFRAFEPVDLRDEAVWLPGVGVIAELTSGLRAKANWKRAFRRPSFAELFHPDQGDIRGNPSLRSERAWNADAGLELAADRVGPLRDLFVQAAVFRRDIDESIEWMITQANAIMPINTGEARVEGIELGASFELFERLDLELSHTWTDARFTGRRSANPVWPVDRVFPHVPRRALSARAGFAIGELRLHGELRFESEIALQIGREETVDSALQFDAGLVVRANAIPGLGFLPRGISLSLDAVNLGREQRQDSLAQPLPRERLIVARVRARAP